MNKTTRSFVKSCIGIVAILVGVAIIIVARAVPFEDIITDDVAYAICGGAIFIAVVFIETYGICMVFHKQYTKFINDIRDGQI